MRISYLKPILSIFFLFINLSPGVYALTPEQVFEKVKDSVVVVKTLDAQGKIKSQGSGVLIPSGKVSTNCHVVEGGSSYLVGRGKRFFSATLFAEDKDKDVCLLDAKDIKGKPAQIGKAVNLKVGAPVYAVGAPKGLELSLSSGIVAQLRGGPPPLIQTTAPISPGSSGGGLFDGDGRLVGLTTLYLEGGQSLNFAMPVEWIDGIKTGRKKIGTDSNKSDWLKRALALIQLKEWYGLLEWSLMWTKSEPQNAEAWFDLGIAYSELNRYNEAIEAYHQTLRIKPGVTEVYVNLGNVYNKLGFYNDGIMASRQALLINPEIAGAWLNLGVAYDNLKLYTEAIEAYRQALRINSEYANAWNNLGGVYLNLNRSDDGIEAFQQALRINPELAEAWVNLWNACQRLKRYNEAIEALRQALRINPKDADAWSYLVLTYYSSQNRTAALDALRELQRIDPEQAEKLFNIVVPR